MPLQPRAGAIKLPDIEKAPLVEEETGLKDHPLPRSKKALRLLLLLPAFLYAISTLEFPFPKPTPGPTPAFIEEGIKQCAIISRPPPHPHRYNSKRKESDRYVKGTPAYHLINATLWTGEKDGSEILENTDLWLQGGVIRGIGKSDEIITMMAKEKGESVEVDVKGAWVTPGIVDLHSHLALDAAPSLRGAADTNSLKSAVLPWLRSLDGFNTHDLAFNLSISGGITTFLALPGSAGNIGGQAFVFKPRQTSENTPQSMQVESPFVIPKDSNGTGEWERTHSWRHIKHACGENPARVFGNTRMDSAYDFRRAYTEGKKLKDEQDRWCASPKTQTAPFPTSLEWEVLSDVIRGHVKVNIHCYETTDLNALVRISNEFQFPIAAFHHAHETYLVPDLLKQAWGSTPAVAIFATNARYKRESYRGSEFAPAILAEAGIDVIMKSDHPVLDSRYLIFEAAQAHHYGLNWTLAMSSVTTRSAKAMGMDHRLGYLREGYDADVVIWDSFPLNLGATPRQTFIDGIAQLEDPHFVHKGKESQEIPKSGDYKAEAQEALTTRGDPDLTPKSTKKNVVFNGVSALYHDEAIKMAEINGLRKGLNGIEGEEMMVVVKDGELVCVGDCAVENGVDFEFVDLKGGAIAPGMITVGSYLGLMEIRQEKATWDGNGYDVLSDSNEIVDGLLVRAADGVAFGGKDELLAYKYGVTSGVAFPISSSFISGLSVQFSTSSPHPLSPHAILTPQGALHINMEASSKYSTSTKIGMLRRLLEGGYKESSDVTDAFKAVAKGKLRLVVGVGKADTMAALVRLKEDVAPGMKMTFLGGQESWMIAESIAAADIGVIVSPSRTFPGSWATHRILPGPPLSNVTLPVYLHTHGVQVGLGINEEWQARNTRLEVGWEYLNSRGEDGKLGKMGSLDLVSKNLEVLLGLEQGKKVGGGGGWVAWEGDLFGFEGVVRGVRNPAGGVDLF